TPARLPILTAPSMAVSRIRRTARSSHARILDFYQFGPNHPCEDLEPRRSRLVLGREWSDVCTRVWSRRAGPGLVAARRRGVRTRTRARTDDLWRDAVARRGAVWLSRRRNNCVCAGSSP